MDDQVVVSNYRVHKADHGTDLGDVDLAPRKTERIFNPALYFHHFEQRMLDQVLDLAFEQSVQVPKLIDFNEVRVITRDDEIRIIFQEQIGDVIEMDQAIQGWR